MIIFWRFNISDDVLWDPQLKGNINIQHSEGKNYIWAKIFEAWKILYFYITEKFIIVFFCYKHGIFILSIKKYI